MEEEKLEPVMDALRKVIKKSMAADGKKFILFPYKH